MLRPWLQTYEGNAFFLDDIENNVFSIYDIAAALSKQCRFSGHVSDFYSVAEHSYHCSFLVPPQYALTALLHDASEAYLVDVPKPVKALMPAYCELEDRVMGAIAKKFNIVYPFPKTVKEADNAILFTERNCLLAPTPYPWIGENEITPANVELQCWHPYFAEEVFIRRFYELGGKE